MSRGGGPVVVKLGGSFAFSNRLRDWIATLASCAGRVVIVPGGGPFADAVRSAQATMGFDDQAAHHMAVLAIEQFGRALIGLNDMLSPADSAAAIKGGLAAGRVPVWMPAGMVLAARNIPGSWDVTSDSLAAWLAGTIGASRLLLIKHVVSLTGRELFEDLAARGIVDKAFPRFHKMSAVSALILDSSDYEGALAAIRNGADIGVPVQCIGPVAIG